MSPVALVRSLALKCARRCLLVAVALFVLPCSRGQEPAAHAHRDLAVEIAALRELSNEDIYARGRMLFRTAAADDLPVARASIFEAPPSVANDILASVLMERWGELDGPAAYAFAAAQISTLKPTLEIKALRGWAKHEPRNAWTRLLLVSNRGADPRYAQEELLEVIAETDLTLGLELFQDLMADRSCLFCNASVLVLRAIRSRQLPLIRAEIAQLAPGPSRNALRDAYWNMLGRFAVQDALALVGQVSNPDDLRAARVQLASGWATRDFSAALDHVLADYDSATIDQTVLPMIQAWARGAVAEDVGATIRKLPRNLSERSLLGVVPVLARVDPAAATDWARTFTNEPIRNECLQRAMWEWAHIDGESAQAYLRAQTESEVRGRLLRSFLLARVGNNTLRLADLEDLKKDYNAGWVAEVLAELALRLADPSINRTGSFDLNAFADWVGANSQLNEEQRRRALAPLRPAPAPARAPG